jgi:NAD-dependent DNA ligase
MSSLSPLKKVIEKAQEDYNEPGNEDIFLEDEDFDAILSFYEEETNTTYTKIGSLPRDRLTNLPYPLPSINKIKGKENEIKLKAFETKYPGYFVITDKLDGICCCLVYSENNSPKAYNRGNGEQGQDISFIFEHLKLPTIQEDLVVRGELILHQETFSKLQEEFYGSSLKMKKARTLLNGALIRKDLTNSILSHCHFYAFEILNQSLSQEDQLKLCLKYNFRIPFYTIVKNINNNLCQEFLKIRRYEAPYAIDGIVIASNNVFPIMTVNENPKHKVAFKIDSVAVSRVLNIEWNLSSRFGYLTPTIIIEPVEILGSDISRFTGNNGKWIYENHVGIGAVVKVSLGGDVIPTLSEVLIPSKEIGFLPYPCEWSQKGNGRELQVIDYLSYPEIQILKIYHFLRVLEVKDCGLETIRKIYNADNLNYNSFLNLQIDKISKIEGLGILSATKIIEEIKNAVQRLTFPKIMYASDILGEGIGEIQCFNYIKHFPSWLHVDYSKEEITEIKGFGPVLSEQFALKIPLFKEWYWQHSIFHHLHLAVKKIATTNDLDGYIFVFSQFRDENLKKECEERGAIVKDNWVVKCTHLIVRDISSSNSKIQQAITKKILILTIEDFRHFLKNKNV